MGAPLPLAEMLRRRHRNLQTSMAALEFDRRARRVRVAQLAEELVAHATVEQLVLYPYAEELLGVHDLSLEIDRSLDALLGVVGGVEDDEDFAVAMARLSASFERHVDGDEIGLLPMIEAMGVPEQLLRMELTIEEFERALSTTRSDGPAFWPDVPERTGGRN
jgi:hypothetical protein